MHDEQACSVMASRDRQCQLKQDEKAQFLVSRKRTFNSANDVRMVSLNEE